MNSGFGDPNSMGGQNIHGGGPPKANYGYNNNKDLGGGAARHQDHHHHHQAGSGVGAGGGSSAPAPAHGWTEHTAPEGYVYYYNSKSGVSQWERPMELDFPMSS